MQELEVLDQYAPFKKFNKYKLKFKTKPWITTELQNSISVKNKIFKHGINEKNIIHKT